MAGIYIHIPFCRQRCNYCDFYKSLNTSLMQQFLPALLKEANVRKNYLQNEAVETIYFGGGTPSVLQPPEIGAILEVLQQLFSVKINAEITLEANPDDLSPEYLSAIKMQGVNRLSVGIQAFQDVHLKSMNRRHNVVQAERAIKDAADAGFRNISVDLIYGLPGLTPKQWQESLDKVARLPVQHLSAYHLTYHEGTVFYARLKNGKLKEVNENESVEQFNRLADSATAGGFEQYEISNFARHEMYSQHNSAYWMGKKYLGLGPSAHSFDGVSRRWNVPDVETYINALKNGISYSDEEILSEDDCFNEYILTRIRTKWGISFSFIDERFGNAKLIYLKKQLQKYDHSGMLLKKNDTVCLTHKGLFVSDEIMADLMIVE